MRFSIAMATHDGERFLLEQLESIAAQDRRPDELLICDDASRDGTVNLIQQFAARAPFKVSLEVNTKNVGSTQTFGSVIRRCSGDVIVLADQDDVWLPRKLRLMADCLERESDIGLVFSDALLVDENRRSLGKTLWQNLYFTFPATGTCLHKPFAELVRRNIVTGATMAFRRKYLDLVLPIHPGWVHDGWIAILISAVTPIAAIPEPLIEYRQHARQQIGARQTFLKRIRRAVSLTAEDYAREADLYSAVKQRLSTRSEAQDRWVMESLEEKVRHLRFRACTFESYFKRMCIVSQELCSGNYHRFSYGYVSALKDLVYKPHRTPPSRISE